MNVEEEVFMYTGNPQDPTGLYYFGARFYDPTTGRFITEDSYNGSKYAPPSQNRYVYALDNPMKYVDENGHDSEKYWGPTEADLYALLSIIIFEFYGKAPILNVVPPYLLPLLAKISKGAVGIGNILTSVLFFLIVKNDVDNHRIQYRDADSYYAFFATDAIGFTIEGWVEPWLLLPGSLSAIYVGTYVDSRLNGDPALLNDLWDILLSEL
jgi:RHS repeat-associated protein